MVYYVTGAFHPQANRSNVTVRSRIPEHRDHVRLLEREEDGVVRRHGGQHIPYLTWGLITSPGTSIGTPGGRRSAAQRSPGLLPPHVAAADRGRVPPSGWAQLLARGTIREGLGSFTRVRPLISRSASQPDQGFRGVPHAGHGQHPAGGDHLRPGRAALRSTAANSCPLMLSAFKVERRYTACWAPAPRHGAAPWSCSCP